jgi:hypothetical protein
MLKLEIYAYSTTERKSKKLQHYVLVTDTSLPSIKLIIGFMVEGYAAPLITRSCCTDDDTFTRALSNADPIICKVQNESELIVEHGITLCLILCSPYSSETSVFSSHPYFHNRTMSNQAGCFKTVSDSMVTSSYPCCCLELRIYSYDGYNLLCRENSTS